MRTCRTSACSPLPSGGSCSTSTTSTRRSRPVGVGCQAPGGEHADRRARQRLRASRTRSGSCWTRSRPYRTAMRELRGHEQPRRLVRAHRHRDHCCGSCGAQLKPRMVKRTEKALAKARTQDSMSAFSKLTEMVDGEARIVDQSPLIVPIDKLAAERRARRDVRGAARLLRSYREHAASTTGACCWRSSSWSTSPARSSASAASARARGSR